jgi:hypothetical protein
MSGSGQERRIGGVRNISDLSPRADVGADIVEPPLCAKTGREQLQHHAVCGRQSYSITSSARNKSDVGMDIPSA